MKVSHLAAVSLVLILGSRPAIAAPDEYDDSQSHPLRVVAYFAYPVGLLLEWAVFRPIHLLASGTKAQEYVFGHTPHPPLLAEPQPMHNYGVSKRMAAPSAAMQTAPTSAEAQEPVAEKVRVVEVPVEKIVEKEVPKIVEVERLVFPAVAFRFDSADLTELGKGQVYLAAQRLKEKSDVTVVVEGHTDTLGKEEYNLKLRMQRAQTIMKELSDQGIESSRMSAASLGESKPLINQETGWARAVNRRVEFQVK